MSEHVNAFVVFTGKTDIPWLKVLKAGFRHCFVLLNDGAHWVSVDPLSNYTDVLVHDLPPDFDLPLYLRRRGMRVVQVKPRRQQKQAPPGLFTCVESVKRVLGIHSPFIVTPWQFYRFLTLQKGETQWGV